MKTQAQIDEEIKALKEMKPNVRRTTMFGDNNHEAIDAAVKVLEKNMDDDAIRDEWPEDEGQDVHNRESARNALKWCEDDDPELEAPSVGWKELIVPAKASAEKGA